MADNHITFKIGSAFNGEGFEKANQAIKDNRKEISASVRGLGELSSAFKNVSPGAAAAADGVGKFAAAFVSGGIAGGVISLALEGISLAVEKVSQHFAEAAEATKKYAAILKDEVMAALGDTTARFKSLQSEMAESSRLAKDVLSVLNGDVAHDAANKLYELHVSTINKLTDDMSATERAIILAEESRQAAIIRATAAEEQAANAVNAYQTALDNAAKVKEGSEQRAAKASEKLAELTEKSAEYLDKRKTAENYLATQEERFAEGQISLKDVIDARKNVALKLSELEETYKDDVSRLKDATSRAEAAKKDVAAAEYEYQRAQDRLHQAVQKREEAERSITTAELDGSLKVTEAQKSHAEVLEAEAKKHQEALDASGGFIDAWNGFMDSLENLGNSMDEAADGMGGSGKSDFNDGYDERKLGRKVRVVNPNDIGNSVGVGVRINNVREDIVKPRKLDDATFERIKKGQASVADWKRFDRFTEREERDAESSTHRIGADAARFISNADKPESWLSSRDLQFQEDFKSRVLPQLPVDVATKLLGDASKHVLVKDDLAEFLGTNSNIVRMLKNLGLK